MADITARDGREARTALDVAGALADPEAPPPGTGRRPRWWLRILVALVLVAALAGGVVAGLALTGTEEDPAAEQVLAQEPAGAPTEPGGQELAVGDDLVLHVPAEWTWSEDGARTVVVADPGDRAERDAPAAARLEVGPLATDLGPEEASEALADQLVDVVEGDEASAELVYEGPGELHGVEVVSWYVVTEADDGRSITARTDLLVGDDGDELAAPLAVVLVAPTEDFDEAYAAAVDPGSEDG